MVDPATTNLPASTPAQKRAELLGADTIKFLAELAANAPPLTDAQKDVIRGAFRGTATEQS